MKIVRICALALLAPALGYAGSADVRFVEPAKYRDAGFGERDTAITTEALAQHLRLLSRRLPEGQVLKVDVLDVDLAGWLRPRPGSAIDIRIVTGGADWPMLKLRYTLESGGRVLQSGEETLSDMNYTWQIGTRSTSRPYGYELRMLDRWFAQRFESRQ